MPTGRAGTIATVIIVSIRSESIACRVTGRSSVTAVAGFSVRIRTGISSVRSRRARRRRAAEEGGRGFAVRWRCRRC